MSGAEPVMSSSIPLAAARCGDRVVSSFGVRGGDAVGVNYKRVAQWLDEDDGTGVRLCPAVSERPGGIGAAEGRNGSGLPGRQVGEGSVFSLSSLNIQILSEQSYILIY